MHERDPWMAAWENQQLYLQELINETATLRREAPDLASSVSRQVTPFEQRLHRDFAMGTAYGKNPRVLEAVGLRIMDTCEAIRQVMAPAVEAQEHATSSAARRCASASACWSKIPSICKRWTIGWKAP